MKKIEMLMVEKAIEAAHNDLGGNWKSGNTEVWECKGMSADGKVLETWAGIYLHGNHIADVYSDNTVEVNIGTLKRFSTRTTLSRLRALGVAVNMRAGKVFINGEEV